MLSLRWTFDLFWRKIRHDTRWDG